MLWNEGSRCHPPPPVAADFPVLSLSHPERRSLPERWRVDELEVTPSVDERGGRRPPVRDVARWLGRLYDLCAAGKRGPAVDLVLCDMDELLFLQDERCCNAILKTADVDRLMVEVMLALLMETFRARSKLAEREGLYQRIEEKLKREEPDEVDDLLHGLR
jgi:hypothetical protein